MLVGEGLAPSVAMGANDVSDATGVFVSTNLAGVAIAGAVGGVALAAGALS